MSMSGDHVMLIGASDPGAMTSEQRKLHDAIAAGPRGGVPAPFLAMLDAPLLAAAIQAVGATIRFSGVLSAAHREVAILATAAAFGSGYEWDYHLPIARLEGVTEEVIALAFSGQGRAASAEAAIVALCRQAVLARTINQTTLSQLTDRVGRAAATEVVAIAGYYQLLGLFLSAGHQDHRPELIPG